MSEDKRVDEWTKEHGNRARTARENALKEYGLPLPIDEAAKRFNGNPTIGMLREIESGTRFPTESQIHNMADVYKVDTFFLLMRENEAPEETETAENADPVKAEADESAGIMQTEEEIIETDDVPVKKEIPLIKGDTIGERLKNRREAMGLKRPEVTERLGGLTSPSTLGRYERGVNTIPYVILAAVAKVYKRKPENFATEAELENLKKVKNQGGYKRKKKTGNATAPSEGKEEKIAANEAVQVKETGFTPDENLLYTAEAVKKAREDSGLTTEEAAAAAGITHEEYLEIEKCRSEIGFSMLLKIAPVIKLSIVSITENIFPGRWLRYAPSNNMDLYRLIGWCKTQEKEIVTRPINNWESVMIWIEGKPYDIIKKAKEEAKLEGRFYNEQ